MTSPKRSLRTQVLNWLMVLFCILLAMGCGISYLAAVEFANLPYDQKLLATADAIGRQVNATPTGYTFYLPESIRGPLLQDDADHVIFKVSRPDGEVLGGDESLPSVAGEDNLPGPRLITTEIGGVAMRLATIEMPVGDLPDSTVIVQVAETMVKRSMLAREIFVKLLIPQIILAILPIAGLWIGLGSGLAPLERLRTALSARQPEDLRPVEIEDDTPDEVRPLIEGFNELLGRMQRLLEVQKRFVADAAHQLRTPLAGVKTQAELALRLDDPDAIRGTLRQVLAGAERGSNLVNQLLSLARHEEGHRAEALRERVDLNQAVQSAATTYVSAAMAKGIDLGFEACETRVAVEGEPISLREMVGNLIDNAIRYTQPGGRVTARVEEDRDEARVVVEDNGPGIPAADRKRIFERFYRGLGTGEEGSGLGLAIVREIAALHGGTVEVTDGADARGSMFVIRLPRAAPLEDQPAPHDAPVYVMPPGSAPGSSPAPARSRS